MSRVVVAINRWLLPGSVCNRIATRGIDPSHRVLKTHPTSLINNADKLVFADSYRLVKDHSPVARNAVDHQILAPAIAIPVRTKLKFECPGEQIALLEQRLANTTHVLIVGWRGRDQHFAELLHRNLCNSARIQIVCGSEKFADETETQLRYYGVNNFAYATDHSFSSYVLSKEGHPFLREAMTHTTQQR